MLHEDEYKVIKTGEKLTEKYRAECDECGSIIETHACNLKLCTDFGVVKIQQEDCPMCNGYASLDFERYYGD